jgi:hypothetical protein
MDKEKLAALEEQIRDAEAEEREAADIQARKEGWDSAAARQLHESIEWHLNNGWVDDDEDTETNLNGDIQ